MPERTDILSWLRITRTGEERYRDQLRTVDLMKGLATGSLDVVVLPGDNADGGTAEPPALARNAISGLTIGPDRTGLTW